MIVPVVFFCMFGVALATVPLGLALAEADVLSPGTAMPEAMRSTKMSTKSLIAWRSRPSSSVFASSMLLTTRGKRFVLTRCTRLRGLKRPRVLPLLLLLVLPPLLSLLVLWTEVDGAATARSRLPQKPDATLVKSRDTSGGADAVVAVNSMSKARMCSFRMRKFLIRKRLASVGEDRADIIPEARTRDCVVWWTIWCARSSKTLDWMDVNMKPFRRT